MEGIQVVVRVRPPVRGETAKYDPSLVSVDGDTSVAVRDVKSVFDRAFDTDAYVTAAQSARGPLLQLLTKYI